MRCSNPFDKTIVHDLEAFGPVSTIMPYEDLDQAIALSKMGKGSLVASLITHNKMHARDMILATASHHGRMLVLDRECAKESTGHGSPLPNLVHGGPGRAGGGEELHWTLAMEFDAMGALSTKYNETPEKASRTYDANRDGFVISGGGGIVVVEELEHALARGAHIYAEITGYGATSDGYDMVAPSGEGAVRCMKQAMQGLEGGIDYLNTHGTSTPVGDVKELGAIQEVFGGNSPMISATKAMTGHALGAAGVHEAIFSLLMLEHNFVAPSINIDELDEQAAGLNIVTERKDVELNTVMSNSFGFGGTNGSMVVRRLR